MKKSLKEKLEYWSKQVEKYEESGLSAGEYSRRSGLNFRQFSYWKRRTEAEKCGFVEISNSIESLDKAMPHVFSGVLIRTGSLEIELTSGFEPSVLETALRIIIRVC